jgi:hypothetical protein
MWETHHPREVSVELVNEWCDGPSSHVEKIPAALHRSPVPFRGRVFLLGCASVKQGKLEERPKFIWMREQKRDRVHEALSGNSGAT